MDNHGSALITGMIAALSVGLVSAVILQQSQVTDKQTRIPRIKSTMMMVEVQLQEALNQNIIVRPCVSGVPNCVEIDHAVLDDMSIQVPGSQCSSAPCGVFIENRNYNGGVFTADIVYNGTEVSVAPVNVSLSPASQESWQTQTTNCNPALGEGPLLVGFNADGSKICRNLPADCPAGSYVRSIDPMSLTSGGVVCEPFPANVECPPGQILSSFNWTGGSGGAVRACIPALNPFSPTVLNDPTTYEYAPPITPVVSSWPVTTTTVPCAVPLAWSCTGGECYPGPDAGCSYGGFRTAHGAPDMEGQVCATQGSFYSFQRTSPVGVTCDVGHLSCQCGSGPTTTTTSTTTTTTMPLCVPPIGGPGGPTVVWHIVCVKPCSGNCSTTSVSFSTIRSSVPPGTSGTWMGAGTNGFHCMYTNDPGFDMLGFTVNASTSSSYVEGESYLEVSYNGVSYYAQRDAYATTNTRADTAPIAGLPGRGYELYINMSNQGRAYNVSVPCP